MAKPIVFDGPEEMGSYVAAQILTGIDRAARDGKRYLLGCPTGPTPFGHSLPSTRCRRMG
ncbi:hypothetical protein [Sinorhizobium mexicanum]|uniref:Uncharacterized protein n=1 Tax=Sinorhizobium mexicanum TaxID=375549 RepID=A0A859R0H1_9HYPH|nr:hypothetical protein [Sinorhizobium mexicanum]MBP1886271.1 hypothetical protein [Sinorhizobium mexicanum]QLL65129.1 hypothetical protein FKV68_27615 [Sinorhizobium mexicanum]